MIRVFLAAALFAGGVQADEEEGGFDPEFLYGGEVTASFAPKDRGYFNQTEYRRDSLRLFRLNLALELRAFERLALLAEIRSDNLDAPKPYALYVRFRPFREHSLDVQAGRIPPVFGAFSRRRYDVDNPLIGYPVPYQYPTVLRADAAPYSLGQLLLHRGHGTRSRYAIGDPAIMEGLAQVNPLRWDTGVEVKLGGEDLALAVALTQGTISNPRFEDDNEGKQIAGRLGWRPAFGAEVGFSAARGDYVSDEVKARLADRGDRSSNQSSLGLDSELARGPWLVRGEAIWTRWDVPSLDAIGSLDVLGFLVEARYKIRAGFFAAARVSGATFESLDGPGGAVSWDAPLTRIEAGVGYAFQRHVLAKFVLQHNERDGGPASSSTLPAVQVLFWF
jgi:hypothetical protein